MKKYNMPNYEYCGECRFRIDRADHTRSSYCILLNRILYVENGELDIISPIECPKFRGEDIEHV